MKDEEYYPLVKLCASPIKFTVKSCEPKRTDDSKFILFLSYQRTKKVPTFDEEMPVGKPLTFRLEMGFKEKKSTKTLDPNLYEFRVGTMLIEGRDKPMQWLRLVDDQSEIDFDFLGSLRKEAIEGASKRRSVDALTSVSSGLPETPEEVSKSAEKSRARRALRSKRRS